MKRVILGPPPEGSEAPNPVEWRLDSPALAAATRVSWLRSPRAIGGLAVAAALELAIIIGGAYALIEHLGHDHGAEHAAHAHTSSSSQNEGVDP